MRPPSPSIPERDFLLSALQQSLRLDGRALLEARQLKLTFGSDLGWVECSLGKTRVLAQVEAKMIKPQPERPFEGVITIHLEISPMASSDYEIGRPSDEEVAINRMLDKILRRSDAIDKESLCILAGQRVWHLRLTLHCLADAGNLLDCAALAGIVALKHFRRPEVEVIGDEVTVYPPSERAPMPLAIHHTPFCFTFAYFPSPQSSAVRVLDPNELEQRLCTGTITIALNAQKEICVLQKLGGVPLVAEEVLDVTEIAVIKATELNASVEQLLAEDWAKRAKTVELR